MLCVFFSPSCQEKRKYKNAKEEKILKSSPLSFASNLSQGFEHFCVKFLLWIFSPMIFA